MPGRSSILVVTPWWPSPEHPGTGTFVVDWVRGAAQLHDIAVLHLDRSLAVRPGRARAEEGMPAAGPGVPVVRCGYGRIPVPRISWPLATIAAFIGYQRLRRIGVAPDLVHVHVYRAATAGWVLARLRRVPLVMTEHLSSLATGTLTSARRLEARFAYRLPAELVAVSRELADTLISVTNRPVTVIRNPVDTETFRPPTDGDSRTGVLFVGRLEEVKGCDLAVDAVAQLARGGTEVRLTVVGEGTLAAKLAAQAVESGISQLVTFLGARDRNDVADFMRTSALLLLPSRYETYSCVAHEAISSGLPVVATRVGALPRLLEGRALLVEPDDSAALAEAARRVLDHEWAPPKDVAQVLASEAGFPPFVAALAALYGRHLP